MKRLILTGALMLAATGAYARTVTLWGDHAVCVEIPIIAQFVDVSVGQAVWEAKLEDEIRRGRCGVAIKGLTVKIERQVGMFSCIRALDFPVDRCRWTVLRPKDVR